MVFPGMRTTVGWAAGAMTMAVDSGTASASGASSGAISGIAAAWGGVVQASASKLSHLPQRGCQLSARVPQVPQIQAGSGGAVAARAADWQFGQFYPESCSECD